MKKLPLLKKYINNKIELVSKKAQEALNRELDQFTSKKTTRDTTMIKDLYNSMQSEFDQTLKKMGFAFTDSLSPDMTEINAAYQSLQISPQKSRSPLNVYILLVSPIWNIP